MNSGFRAGGRAFWSAFTKARSFRTSGVAGLGMLLLGQTLRAKMVASYSFGSHFDGSSSYPKKSVLPDDCIIVTGSTNKHIAEEIAAHLGCKLFPIETGKFKDGETFVKFDSSIDGKHVILVCPQGSPANDSIFETLLLISSMKRNGAKSISLYLPYSCYARQDKMTGPWRSLAFSDLATYYENSGVDRVITLDIHNEAVMGCFSQSINAHNMTAINLAASYISQAEKLNNMIVLSPDEGGVKRAKKFFDYYQSQTGDVNADSKFVIMLKQRERPNEVASMTITSDVAGKDCILIDDMIDTGVSDHLTAGNHDEGRQAVEGEGSKEYLCLCDPWDLRS